jgi:hypothetical protein
MAKETARTIVPPSTNESSTMAEYETARSKDAANASRTRALRVGLVR